MINYFKQHKDIIIWTVITIVMTVISAYNIVLKKNAIGYGDSKYVICFVIAIIVIYAILNYFIYKMYKNKKIDYVKTFIFASLILGVFYISLAPYPGGSDESTHFYRIYELASGNMETDIIDGTVGSYLPSSLSLVQGSSRGTDKVEYHDILNMINIKLNKNETKRYNQGEWTTFYANTALYSGLQYIPEILATQIGILFNMNPYFIAILCRVFNLAAFIILGSTILKLFPYNKLYLLITFISPVMLANATTISADAFVSMIILLFITLILHMKKEQKIQQTCMYVTLVISAIIIAMSKVVYFPFVLLIFLLDSKNFKSNNNKKLFVALTIIISMIAVVISLSMSSQILALAYNKSELQKAFILGHPFEYLIIMIQTYIKNLFIYLNGLVAGTYMYHSTVDIPAIFSFIYLLILYFTLHNEEIKVSKKDRILYAIIFISIVVLISTAEYIQCTSYAAGIGADTIVGLQGRYFVPLLFLLPLIFNFKQKKIDDKRIICTALYINLIVFIFIIVRFI